MTVTYYKYRSLSNLRWFIDIILNKRLYMSHFTDMNDPMEGAFLFNRDTSEAIRQLRIRKRKMLICCLSRSYKNTLMWTHYADSHKGCCIEVKVDSKVDCYNVDYSSDIQFVRNGKEELIHVLTTKSSYWSYEEEVRFIKEEKHNYLGHNTSRPFLSVTPVKIYIGYCVSEKDFRFYEKLIKSILGENFPVVKMSKEDIETGYRGY